LIKTNDQTRMEDTRAQLFKRRLTGVWLFNWIKSKKCRDFKRKQGFWPQNQVLIKQPSRDFNAKSAAAAGAIYFHGQKL